MPAEGRAEQPLAGRARAEDWLVHLEPFLEMCEGGSSAASCTNTRAVGLETGQEQDQWTPMV